MVRKTSDKRKSVSSEEKSGEFESIPEDQKDALMKAWVDLRFNVVPKDSRTWLERCA